MKTRFLTLLMVLLAITASLQPQMQTLAQVQPLAIATTILPYGTQGAPYSATVTAAGGTAPYTWAVTVGALPAGLTLDAATGAISGTPTLLGSDFTVQVTDSAVPAATHTHQLSILIAGGTLPGGTLVPTTITKYATPMIIPPEMPTTSSDYYEIAVRQFQQQILPAPLPRTTVWSYGSATSAGTFNFPAFTIEARYGVPLRVKWINDLVDAAGNYLPHLLPIDQTLHWANPPGGIAGRDSMGMNPASYTGPVPMITHVHGAHTVEDSDGFPEAWYLPAAANIPAGYATVGSSYDIFKAKAAVLGRSWQPGSALFEYPNDQRATTLWYHDHTVGMTRTNVYAGPAGFYLLRGGPSDLPSGVLPGPAPKVGDAPGTKYYEIPIAIQDRSFNADGSLFYPSDRAFFEGVPPADLRIPFVPGATLGAAPSDISPIWNPEFFGNTTVVNGNTWPYLNVEQRQYRFRLLNGSQSRFLILKLDNGGTFYQIGSEGGFLPAVVPQTQLLLGPAERADVIIDFTNVPIGTNIIMQNIGPDAPFGGGLPGVDFPIADPATTGQVMQFRVGPIVGTDTSVRAGSLVLPPLAPVGAPARTQFLSLNEDMSMTVWATVDPVTGVIQEVAAGTPGAFLFGPKAALLGTFNPATALPTPLGWMAPTTEKPNLGSTEMWEIHNFTADAHPIHIHLVMFQVVERVNSLGVARPPEIWENGFKDTVIAYPGEITRVKAIFDIPALAVWHCHILEHEDNEMMRPYLVYTPPVVGEFDGATIFAGGTYTGSGTFTSPGVGPWTATVDYGDGSGVQPLALNMVSFGLSHVYPTAGTYTVTVRVTDSSAGTGTRTASVVVAATPPAPSVFAAAARGGGRVDLTWQDNSANETGFHVSRSLDSGFVQGLTVFNVAADAVSYSDTTAADNTTYYYRVSSYNAGGDSTPSNTSTVVTPTNPATAPPPAVGSVGASLAPGAVNVNWAYQFGSETGFVVQRALDPQFSTGLTNFTVAARLGTFADVTVAPATTYSYRVYAFNGGGNSSVSNVVTVTTTLPAAPAAPTALTAVAVSSGRVDLNWTDNSNNETGFRLERATDAGFTAGLTTFNYAANTVSQSDTTVAGSTTYFYRVAALNAGGASAVTAAATATTPAPPSGIPPAASGLAATAVGQSQVNLSWTDNSLNEAGFRIERAADAGFGTITVINAAANATSYSDTTVAAGTTYHYRVVAHNVSGNAAASNVVNVTTDSAPPAAVASSGGGGGGGGAPPVIVTEQKPGVTPVSKALAPTGEFAAPTTAKSQDGKTVLNIAQGTMGVDGNGAPLSEISMVSTLAPPSPPPTGNTAVGLTYELGPSGARFEPPVTLTLSFTKDKLPAGAKTTELKVAFWDAGAKQWVKLESTVNEATFTVSAKVSHFTSFALLHEPAPQPLVLATSNVSQGSVDLKWEDKTQLETGYQIERSTDPAFAKDVSVIVRPANAVDYNDASVKPGTTYYYRIRALGSTNVSPSTVISVKTPPAPLPVTAREILKPIEGKLLVAWSYDAASQTWRLYDPKAPAVVNDLSELKKGQGYFIQVSAPCKLEYGSTTYDLLGGFNLIGWQG